MAHFEGSDLTFAKITRHESGAYLCIASNGFPPSVSKRILLEVECECRPKTESKTRSQTHETKDN